MRRLRIIRVVTAAYVVDWHLDNTLRRLPADHDVLVVGDGVSRYAARYPGVRWADVAIDRKANPIGDLLALARLVALFRRERPDIVHSIMPKAGFLAALAGVAARVPVRIHTFTGQLWADRRGILRWLLKWPDRVVLALNSLCLTDSPSQSAYLQANGLHRHALPLPHLADGSLSGVDPARRAMPADAELARALGIDRARGDIVFAFIARKSLEKGAIDMLDAFQRVRARLPRAWLLFVGPDESNGALAALRARTPGQFDGVIEADRVDNPWAYLALADVLCLPSHREGFGSIVIDAAAAGVPAIGNDIVGLRDAIADGVSGQLVREHDIEGFAVAMHALATDATTRLAMGRAARERATTAFSADRLYQALRALYVSLAPPA